MYPLTDIENQRYDLLVNSSNRHIYKKYFMKFDVSTCSSDSFLENACNKSC